jgi:hypothetical protein
MVPEAFDDAHPANRLRHTGTRPRARARARARAENDQHLAPTH